MKKSQEEKIKIKNSFEVEDLRTELAFRKRYKDFKKTYSNKYPEINANNSGGYWDTKFNIPVKFSDLDGMTRDKINTIIKFLPEENSHILDLGIGQGYLEQRLQELGKNYELYGIDVSKRSIARLKKRIRGKFNIGNVLQIRNYYKKNYFDAVVAIELIEHISPRKIFKLYKDIRSLLKPTGIFILSTPLNEGLKFMKENPSSHVREYTESIVFTELKLSGFRVLEKRCFFAFKNFYRIKRVISLLWGGRWKPNNIVIKAVKA
ncbi:MAG: hypothetical protein A3C30_04025 [Candidatus Levybacteria bacterium RIFCSPHIGHO2_02_FULL_40_18]|nr:MAG: hypothetical protein A3C30_04025 [Candidatus Levybacteria bacterium RIFCSPHIGHO2_02_FULL_40_18]OGH31209.1 MAG: hypothetical protein A3E43_02280 [Candidatus Levybacteria bacterium RIFCSPHIGHO2_12_FULL_40_31]OGH49095.1 MAG: hypothetical protein A3I54_00810 [Candidatus Levybacteria bacterium RIFCSPLOWO2_02_FULL_41_11]OGH53791.1 MAG: hypothetical protein A3G15_04125 [Candidatus Levybacteria bacterium RIFCSPLOWO2_12_FULL_40_10]